MSGCTPQHCAYQSEQALIGYLKAVGVMDEDGGMPNREQVAQSLEMMSCKVGLLLASAIGPGLALIVLGRSAETTARHGKEDSALILRPGQTLN